MKREHPPRNQGWTFVEMLVAISLAAVFLGAATLVFSSISANAKRLSTVVEVDIGGTTKNNFYGQSGSSLQVSSCPNYGRAARVEEFRDLLLDDSEYSSAIFCLPRQLDNSIRPEFLRYSAGDAGSTEARPRLDTPEAFRQFLADVEPTSSAIYDTSIRNVPDSNRPDTTIFMLAPETDPGFIRVRAVYEIDFVGTSSPSGTYVSARRYRNGSLTHYYDIFYDSGSGDGFQPNFVAFERTSRTAVAEGTATDRFKVAEGNPFYFLWLPDPAINPYTVPNWTVSESVSSPRAAYEKMTDKTAFLVVLPMFPNL